MGGCVSEGLKFVAKMQKHQGGGGQVRVDVFEELKLL